MQWRLWPENERYWSTVRTTHGPSSIQTGSKRLNADTDVFEDEIEDAVLVNSDSDQDISASLQSSNQVTSRKKPQAMGGVDDEKLFLPKLRWFGTFIVLLNDSFANYIDYIGSETNAFAAQKGRVTTQEAKRAISAVAEGLKTYIETEICYES